MKKDGPKILVYDIETAPILAYVWALWDQNVGLNQIKSDWYVLGFGAKWLDEKEVFYADQRNAKNIEDDRETLKQIWKLLDEADIVVTQNGKSFDQKKLNARFVFHGMKPPSSYKHIDTLEIAKKHFGFTSNKLEYMSDKLNTKYKKLKHDKFPGFDLWRECLAGNTKAWNEMKRYNIHDVLSLEELYKKLAPWDNSINFNIYRTVESQECNCGANSFVKNGYSYTASGRFQRYVCTACGSERRDKVNLLPIERRKSLRLKIAS